MEHITRKTTTIASLAAALLLLPVLLAGCSSGPGPSGERTADTASGDQSEVAFASCMRDAGYEMSDTAEQPGVLTPPEGVDETAWSKSVEACSAKAHGGEAGTAAEPSAQDIAREEEIGTCMREHGFPDFADDATTGGGEAYTPSDEKAFNEALDRCGGGRSGATAGK